MSIPCEYRNQINLTKYEFPESTTLILMMTFEGCHSLKIESIPKGIRAIGLRCFFACYNITKLVLPEGLTFLGYGGLGDCINLVEIILPSTLKTILPYTFENCYKLESINLEHIKRILRGAFRNCRKLNNLNLKSIIELHFGAFHGCYALDTFYFPSTIPFVNGTPSMAFEEEGLEDIWVGNIWNPKAIGVEDGDEGKYILREYGEEYDEEAERDYWDWLARESIVDWLEGRKELFGMEDRYEEMEKMEKEEEVWDNMYD